MAKYCRVLTFNQKLPSFVVVSGFSGTGKTTVACQAAIETAFTKGKVIFINDSDGENEFMLRLFDDCKSCCLRDVKTSKTASDIILKTATYVKVDEPISIAKELISKYGGSDISLVVIDDVIDTTNNMEKLRNFFNTVCWPNEIGLLVTVKRIKHFGVDGTKPMSFPDEIYAICDTDDEYGIYNNIKLAMVKCRWTSSRTSFSSTGDIVALGKTKDNKIYKVNLDL